MASKRVSWTFFVDRAFDNGADVREEASPSSLLAEPIPVTHPEKPRLVQNQNQYSRVSHRTGLRVTISTY